MGRLERAAGASWPRAGEQQTKEELQQLFESGINLIFTYFKIIGLIISNGHHIFFQSPM